VTSLFLDTSFLIALEARDDQYHQEAKTYWRKHTHRLVTTTYVFDEIVTFFNRWDCHDKAMEIGNALITSPSVELVQVDSELFDKGWHLFQQNQDKRFSLTDCISFALMRQRKLTTALTFDHHFVQAGFLRQP